MCMISQVENGFKSFYAEERMASEEIKHPLNDPYAFEFFDFSGVLICRQLGNPANHYELQIKVFDEQIHYIWEKQSHFPDYFSSWLRPIPTSQIDQKYEELASIEMWHPDLTPNSFKYCGAYGSLVALHRGGSSGVNYRWNPNTKNWDLLPKGYIESLVGYNLYPMPLENAKEIMGR